MDFFEISWDAPAAGFRRGRLRGELDVAAAPVLERDVLQQLADPVEVVVIDLEGLEFLDSSGLRALLMVQEHAQRAGARLVLVPGPPRVQSLFHVAEVESWFEFATGTSGSHTNGTDTNGTDTNGTDTNGRGTNGRGTNGRGTNGHDDGRAGSRT